MGDSPDFSDISLPAVVGGEIERVELAAPIGEAVVVLASYPSNFGPSSGQSATLLRVCEQLASDSDVVGFGVAPESVYSHRQFAREADLSLPLLSDLENEIGAMLDVLESRPGGVTVPTRAMHVLDYRGSVVTKWVASDSEDLPDTQRLGDRIESISPDDSAWGSYRIAYAHYVEGRRLLSRGFEECREKNWDVAQTTFEDACREFGQATDMFMKGQGLATGHLTELNDRARSRSTQLWEASEWLSGFAMAAEKGDQERKRRHRTEAARVLDELGDDLPSPQSVRDTTLADSA